jgi:transposase
MMLPPGAKVFLATERVDGRKGINGLSTLVRSQFAQDPLSGQLFVFFSRRADQVRVLYWDRDGYILTTKRLEVGRFREDKPYKRHPPPAGRHNAFSAISPKPSAQAKGPNGGAYKRHRVPCP